ncbi:hypothetical protein MBLNU230_g5493t1 [Neophaeotheca triangularis]
MKRDKPIDRTVYQHLFPHPTPQDPPSFAVHLARNLVPEIRIEVATFYGDLATVEARYPGLNYTHPSHRMRLGRFNHHRRLFGAFDKLGLTEGEIQGFCQWEGTKWARERYEADEGVKVNDTTGSEIGPYVDRKHVRRELAQSRKQSITKQTDIEVLVEDAHTQTSTPLVAATAEADANMSDADESESEAEDDETVTEGEQQAAEAALFERLDAARSNIRESSLSRRAATQRLIEAWENGQNLDPDLEQFLKDQSERGMLAYDMDLSAFVNGQRLSNGAAAA